TSLVESLFLGVRADPALAAAGLARTPNPRLEFVMHVIIQGTLHADWVFQHWLIGSVSSVMSVTECAGLTKHSAPAGRGSRGEVVDP
ncbi:hypothetical protein ACFV9G_22095, partial [Nocardioides sp. NPDC059952]|uniref:hypothetical protein n=1 Tax=Nocardioides sp. NPDC059952 TaxID=3347014 RepID=UPI003649DFCA